MDQKKNSDKSGEGLRPGVPNGERDQFSGDLVEINLVANLAFGKRVRDFEGREDLREINLVKISGRSI